MNKSNNYNKKEVLLVFLISSMMKKSKKKTMKKNLTNQEVILTLSYQAFTIKKSVVRKDNIQKKQLNLTEKQQK